MDTRDNKALPKSNLPLFCVVFALITAIVISLSVFFFVKWVIDITDILGYLSLFFVAFCAGLILDGLFHYFWNRNIGTIISYYIIIIFGILFLYAIFVPNIHPARDNAKFVQCLESLSGIKVAEEIYHIDNGEFGRHGLSPYMIAGVTNPNAESENTLVQRISSNCDGKWSLEMIDLSEDRQSYIIRANSNDRYNCLIEITPEGYLPTSYRVCIKNGTQKPEFKVAFKRQRMLVLSNAIFSFLLLAGYFYFKYRKRNVLVAESAETEDSNAESQD
ncbi:hypothetical protein ACFLQK_02295 [bacterium]